MKKFTVEHLTLYRYHRPVSFGPHRLMSRPRDSHDFRLTSTGLLIEPAASVRWIHDVFGNSIAIAEFQEPAAELRIVSTFEVEHYGLIWPDFDLDADARLYPFRYAAEEREDLRSTSEIHYPDPEGAVARWARGFVEAAGGIGSAETVSLLADMTRAINRDFGYQRRYAVGTQEPTETLALGTGTCRDLALLMMEAVRSLGFAARFVSGYLYDPSLDGSGVEMRGAGDTHAWLSIYLPGSGWIEFDPTNGIVGGQHLIRVATARDPSQAQPIIGSYIGAAEDFIDMTVEVRVAAG